MVIETPKTTYLQDYAPPAYRIPAIELRFELGEDSTTVHSRLSVVRAEATPPGAPLALDGQDLELLSLALNGEPLATDRYRLEADRLTLLAPPEAFELAAVTRIYPQHNASLEGLYQSNGNFCTQCEAEGFRKITYFLDRPDVMAVFSTTLVADPSRYPVLLSNGNRIDGGELDDGRRWATWHDPFPKPCYLFALVAGRLDCIEDRFLTRSGRAVDLRIYVEPSDLDQCQHAMQSLKQAMAWDERRFGLEYDLDLYQIVAVGDFNMGAMENKGLNIFNARYILADADTATDTDFEGVESVIGHEYFHNWSGNRVTLRDWFQLSLKEGLTVFRDQEFTSDRHSRALKRIEDVRLLKSRQYVEDAGPLSHPVRPSSYTEINNFYTATVYEKGAEVVRMLHTLLGEAAFRAGLDRYFERHDGGAATVEDFLASMAQASGRDLSHFARWYDQPGTPELRITQQFDPARGEYRIEIEQGAVAAPDASMRVPLHIPLAYALYDAAGQRIERQPQADAVTRAGLIELTAERHTLRFEGLTEAPLPAFLQGLSAPVRLQVDYTPTQLARLVRCEPDPLTRWESAQRLATDAILRRGNAVAARSALLDVLGELLADAELDPGFIAECHQLPDVWTLADQCESIDLDAIWREREDLLDTLAETHAERFEQRYRDAALGDEAIDADAIARRRLKNLCLARLTRLDPTAVLAASQFAHAVNLTDRLAALAALLHHDAPDAAAALAAFRSRYASDALVTDKWLGLVATRPQPDAVEGVAALLRDPLWTPRNPNRVRAVLGNFARTNVVGFHRRDGAGYALLFDQALALDALNPQVAARQLTVLENWQRLDPQRRGLVADGLRRLEAGTLSRDCADVVTRLLVGAARA